MVAMRQAASTALHATIATDKEGKDRTPKTRAAKNG